MGSFYMESTQINYRRDDTLKTVDQKLQELSETSAIDTDIAPVFKSTNTYAPGDMVYYRNKLYVFNVEHTGAWAAGDVTATDVTTEISSLNSGLTNYEATTNAALSVPGNAGRNVISTTLADLKLYNTTGTWVDNTYTRHGVTFTVNTNASGYITSIVATGTASDNVYLMVAKKVTYKEVMKMTGCPANGGFDTYQFCAEDIGVATYRDYGSGINLPVNTELDEIYFVIRSGYEIASGGLTFYPMIRPSYITDTTFYPYIPSVESRIEAVESGDYKVIASVTGDGVKTVAQLLPDLFSSVPSYTKRCSLIYGKAVLPMAEKTTNNAKFGNVSNYQGTTYFLTVNIQPSTAYLTEVSIASNGTITVTDRSTDIPTNGSVVSLVQ